MANTKGCDSATNFGRTDLMVAMVQNHYSFVGRYLNRQEGVRDGLTEAEVNRISSSHIFIVSLYESNSGNKISHFTYANGVADAEEAVSLAKSVGMPRIYPIYFCVDTDVSKAEYESNVGPYIEGMLSVMEDSGYKPGIYGSKAVCKKFRGNYKGYERYTFICDNSWSGTGQGWTTQEQDFDDYSIRQYKWNQPMPDVPSVLIDECDAPGVSAAGGWYLEV